MNNWRLFVSFLKEEEAWEAYKTNIRKHRNKLNIPLNLRAPLSSFYWTDTPEGLQYWMDINRKWEWRCYEQKI